MRNFLKRAFFAFWFLNKLAGRLAFFLPIVPPIFLPVFSRFLFILLFFCPRRHHFRRREMATKIKKNLELDIARFWPFCPENGRFKSEFSARSHIFLPINHLPSSNPSGSRNFLRRATRVALRKNVKLFPSCKLAKLALMRQVNMPFLSTQR